jgi:hypothetical protein
MAEVGSRGARRDSQVLQKATTGYQAAIDLWTYQGEQWWARFNIMLLANSIVVAAATVVLTSPQSERALALSLPALSLLLPAAGLVLGVLWLALINREIVYADYYLWSARELEASYLQDTVKIVSRGGDLADGNCIEIVADGRRKTLKMAGLAHFRARAVARGVVWLFIALHAAMFLVALSPLLGAMRPSAAGFRYQHAP